MSETESAPSSKTKSSSSTFSPSFPSVLPAGILPVCHRSYEDAFSATHNCSGHGEVYLKYTTGSGGGKGIDCFACKCTATIYIDPGSGSISKTHWGGPACQKIDVSVPFFLLAGFGIAITGAIAWAVGLLFTIGQEDLPSVIGAGVAGAKPR